MHYIRRSEDRGVADFGWLNSKHSFSFGHYYDEKHMGISALRVINDDRVAPAQGFATHGHKDMEIISYVIDGALKHKDSTGNEYIVPAGDIQRMSAGKGVMHSEYNASEEQDVSFLQIWITPNVIGIEPSYEQKTIHQDGPLTPLITPNVNESTLFINQDASVSRLVLTANESFKLTTKDRVGYLHIIKGSLYINDTLFNPGDAVGITSNETLTVVAHDPIEALWFDLPKA